jgi:hypothetical protein
MPFCQGARYRRANQLWSTKFPARKPYWTQMDPSWFWWVCVNYSRELAGTTRLELATSAVTGQRSNQLNYVPRLPTCWKALLDKAYASFL